MRQVSLADRTAFNTAFFLEHLFPNSQRLKTRKANVRARIIDHVRRGGKGKVIEVDRRKDLAPEEFRRNYLDKGIPVVLDQGAANWPCVREWSFDAFKSRFGKANVKLVHREGLSDDDFFDEQVEFWEEMNFGEFLDQAERGTSRKYMRFAPLFEQFPELLTGLDPGFLKRNFGSTLGATYQLFIGGAGTTTMLHNAMTPFFFVNVCGVKRWSLAPCNYVAVLNPRPDGWNYNHSDVKLDFSNADEFPGCDCIDRWVATTNPGDVLFNPSWMWHGVQNDSATIGIRCGVLHPKSMITESFAMTFIRFFGARNPSMPKALYYALFKNNGPQRGDMLETGKIFRL
jgi:hypothetical protein